MGLKPSFLSHSPLAILVAVNEIAVDHAARQQKRPLRAIAEEAVGGLENWTIRVLAVSALAASPV
jgi:hypothetical protein